MKKIFDSRSLTVAAALVALASGCGEKASSSPSGDASTGSSASSGGAASGGSGSGASSGGALGLGGDGSGGFVVNATCPGALEKAYEGTLRAVPGTVEAEDYDVGGYSDATPGNEGAAYRTEDDVDVKAIEGGYAIGWMTAGEWVEYTVNVPSEGDYSLVLNSGAVGAGRTIEVSSCGTSLGTVSIPSVAEWGTILPSTPTTIHLGAGLQVLRLTVGATDYLDLDSLEFELGAASGTGGSGSGGAGTGGGNGTGGALPKFVGNITTGWNGALDYNGLVFSDHWDQVTPENAGKWGSVQSTAASSPNWATLDAIYDYTEDKGIIFKQHTFVWGAQQPTGTITQDNVKSWISSFCARYPHTRVIDVVNEPPPHTTPAYADAIGGGTNTTWQWITNAFKWARESCPNAVLVLNDYNNIEYGDQNQHFIDIAKAIKAAGAPIDAVGAQAHGLSGGVSTATMKNLITKMHTDTGLPVYVTEYDISQADDAAQLAKYKEHIPFFLETEWIHGVTIWGWFDGQTWVDNTGIVKGSTPRPAMTWLMGELGRPSP